MASSQANDVNIPKYKSRSHTNFKVEKHTHEWTISNFSFCQKKAGAFLESPSFSFGVNTKLEPLEWCLRMYPKGCTKDETDYISFFLRLRCTQDTDVKTKYKLGIMKNLQERVDVIDTFTVFNSKSRVWGRHKFIEKEHLQDKTKKLLCEDKLTLFCDIEVITDISITSENIDKIQVLEPKSHLLANLGNVLESQEFSDVTLTACGTAFHAHKYILATQSPVFSAMFKREMEEKLSNTVDIVDMDEEVLKEMLLFLYTGEATNLKKVACGLLAAADKYAIESLKVVCENALLESLTIENAADILIAADLHGAANLKPRVINFISNNAVAVMNTAGYKSIVQQHLSLIAELYRELALRQGNNPHENSTASNLNV